MPVDGPEVIRLTPADEGERVPLFYVGDDEYTIVARPQMEIGLTYLKLNRTPPGKGGGEDAAIYYLLTALLGQDGYDALSAFKGLRQDQFQKIVGIATQMALGALEIPKGPGNA